VPRYDVRLILPLLISLSLTSCAVPRPAAHAATTLDQAALIDAHQDFTQSPRPGYVLDADAVNRPPTVTPTGVIIIGDSIVTGWSGYVAHIFPNALINGRVGRQFSSALHIWAMMHADHETDGVGYVVVELGTNGYVDPAQVAQFMSMVGHRQVFFVVPVVPRSWEPEVQNLYFQLPSRYPNAHLVRWDLLSADHPNYFWSDHVHPTWAGIQVMVHAIAQEVAKYPPPVDRGY
jgi:hypothetical protein